MSGGGARVPLSRRPAIGDVIEAAHGTGGRLTRDLVEGVFVPAFSNPALDRLTDQAVVDLPRAGRLAFTTDAYVVRPFRFPGGTIGDLAVNGTVNDLLMGGATPLYLSAAFILVEGLRTADLRAVVEAMAKAARRARVLVVTGDTKVVDGRSEDGMFVTTSGVGLVPEGIDWRPERIRPGDRVILSGTIADHGASVMASRFEIALESEIRSDSQSLRDAVLAVRDLPGVRCMRDPTRGGLATTAAELSAQSGLDLRLNEVDIPIREDVRGMCEILGIDPLYVASEGKLVAVVAPGDADEAVRRLRRVPETSGARIVGEVVDELPGHATLLTTLGAVRLLDLLPVEQLPRIC